MNQVQPARRSSDAVLEHAEPITARPMPAWPRQTLGDELQYVPRRRLGALEAAAATAVIVACVAALASMTGLLPAALQFNAEPAVAAPVTVSHAAVAGTPAAIVPAGAAPVIHALPTASAAIGPASAPPTESTPQMPPASPQSTADGAQPGVGDDAMQPSRLASGKAVRRQHGARHGRHGRNETGGDSTAYNARAGGQRTGKTREQVIAELLQAKRDGTYQVQSEIYR